MSSDTINARVSAVTEIGHGLASYRKGLAAALSSARLDLNRADAELTMAVVKSQRDVLEAERRTEMACSELRRCREGCGALEEQLRRARAAQLAAQSRHDRHRQAQARVERAAAELRSSLQTIERSADELIPAGRRFVQEYAAILTEYLKTGVPG
jgi:chromosome segregation ATPase